MIIHTTDEDDSLNITFAEDEDDIFNIIRNFGEESIVSIIEGSNLKEVTEDVIDAKPIGFLIEF